MENTILKLIVGFLSAILVDACNLSTPGIHMGQYTYVDTVDLFNRMNLNGWYTYLKDKGRNNDSNKVFSVHEGLLVITGEEHGCIVTEMEFSNYRLDVEFRWGARTFPPRADNARDNGILLHSIGRDGASDGSWMNSIECQIIEGGTGDIIVVGDGSNNFSVSSSIAENGDDDMYRYKMGGKPVTIHEGRINWFSHDINWKDVKGFRGKEDIEKPLGEWNLLQCLVEGNTISIYLNGVMVNHVYNVKPSKGRIQIQSEGAEIFFRKVSLSHIVVNKANTSAIITGS